MMKSRNGPRRRQSLAKLSPLESELSLKRMRKKMRWWKWIFQWMRRLEPISEMSHVEVHKRSSRSLQSLGKPCIIILPC
jgi:hypothetical protein